MTKQYGDSKVNPAIEHTKKPYIDLQRVKGFIAGGLGACCAVTFTNPLEVVKTRLQLQAELVTRKAESPRIYKNLPQALRLIGQKEGLKGLQRGLLAAYSYQIVMNGVRFGCYDQLKHIISSENNLLSNSIAGAMSGALAATLGSPLFLIKTRIQTQSRVSSIAVGTQYPYKGAIDGLATIYKSEGFVGLYRGVNAAALRTAVGSGVQLSVYDFTKSKLLNTKYFEDGPPLYLTTSLIVGFFVCCAMNPLDVVTTRMYAQPHDPVTSAPLRYKSLFHCLRATLLAEGPQGLLKGFTAHYLRIGPHTVLTFIFMEQFRKLLS